jgi:L-amino acid N-acyltransferase
MRVIQCEQNRHAEAILAIFNDAIINSTALYDYKPRTPEMMAAWFDVKSKAKYPVIGIETDSGDLMGFGSYGTFRSWPAYKYSVEHSVYVNARFRGRGVGKRLMQELIAAAEGQGYHILVGAIDAANSASIALHEKLGFSFCGTIRQAGFKLAAGSTCRFTNWYCPHRLIRLTIECPPGLNHNLQNVSHTDLIRHDTRTAVLRRHFHIATQ